ncbi:type II toxin-antitoxin system Phd/YefM family antitoxin [Siccirubricoccus sp. G192]|uniref:type II toxin-antitoxin system Phd/YefM family antitoxin n=1 Tax=Siccirubricoccus sp. G192 TaxID=2849651 RepID=UPI001C2C55E8|nr:type II toxin-antitoxin system prevent-host-death family antitoxin [Siccirubricoccus sp. G192]MBV1800193.1 type II toxin-antitoxin system prevent-host-death family antitoxin [Siccirubricoccus sp. G192]
MVQVSYTEFRTNLATHMDEVVNSRAPLLVTRQGGKGNVVVMSEEEFAGWQETVHLLGNPQNAAHLMRSIAELDAGEGEERKLVDTPRR